MDTGTVRLQRVLRASPERVYRAFLDPAAMAKWLPPHGFTCAVEHMDVRVGGHYRMALGPVNTMQGDRVVSQGGSMQGARAQQGWCLASAGNAADGPFARQPEGKVTRARPSALRSLIVRTHALRRAP